MASWPRRAARIFPDQPADPFRRIVGFARNTVLKATHEALLARAERARFFALSVLGRWDESVREHQEILAALKTRDAARAGQVLAHHVRRTGEIVVETLDETADAAAAPCEGRAAARRGSPDDEDPAAQSEHDGGGDRPAARRRQQGGCRPAPNWCRSPRRAACPISRPAPKRRSAARSRWKCWPTPATASMPP